MKIRSKDGFDDSIRPFIGVPFMVGAFLIYASKNIIFVFISFILLLVWYYFYMGDGKVTKKYWVECKIIRYLIYGFLFSGATVFFINRFFLNNFGAEGFGFFFMVASSVISYPFLAAYGRSLMK